MGRRVLLLLAVLAMSLFAAEGLLRGALRLRGTPYSASAVRGDMLRILEAAEGNFAGQRREVGQGVGQITSPFFGFDSPFGPDMLARDLGRKGRGDGQYRILVLGGSVAAGFGNHGVDVLERMVGSVPGLEDARVQVLGYGVAAFKQPQQLNLLSYLITLGVVPDAVVNLDGFNEVAVGNANREVGVHPLFPSSTKWSLASASWYRDPRCLELASGLARTQSELRERAEAWAESSLTRSSLVGTLGGIYVNALQRRARSLQSSFALRLRELDRDVSVVGPAFGGGAEEAIELSVRCWQESSLSMDALCRKRGITYLHVLQPTLHDEGAKPITDLEAQRGRAREEWLEGVALGYPRLRAAGRELEERGVAFLDASGVFRDVEETLYIDACHFDARGNELLAQQIGAKLAELVAGSR